MSQRQVIARSRRQRERCATSTVIARAKAPAIRHGGRGTLLSGTAFAALVACGLFAFNDRVLAQGTNLPTGGQVVGGSATITQNGTNQLVVNQSTDRGVIDWRSFSIGQGNRVDFIQPGRTSVTLNRVTGSDPSVIAGALNATGQIVLVNQAGVVFAGGAQVNVESLIASTANVANPAAFMAGGRIAFDQAGANPNARIVNDGTITVRDGGLVALLGPSAANNGVINARLGRVTVGGAETFTVDLNGDGLVNFAVGKPVSRTPRDADGKALALASNTGTINADGGHVAITASAAREVVNGVVNVEGRINARTVQNEGGVIVFGGGESTQVNVGGTIDVSGAGAAQKGGTVHVTASKVTVQSTARINANGGAGGGTVLVGGGKAGTGPIPNAKNTTVAKGAIITADATSKGNGGQVIIWADNATVFAGTISAKGGPGGGNGGFAEVSGKTYLSFDGTVDLRATDGFQTGTLLLDPSDITISNSADSNIDVTGGTITGTANASNIKASTIVTLLLTTNVIVDAAGGAGAGSGSIVVNDSITSASGNSLTFLALTNVGINDAVNVGAGNFFVTTTNGTITGAGAITASTLSLTAGGLINLTGKMNVLALNFSAGGAVTIANATNDIFNIAQAASSAGGNVEIFSTETTTVGPAGINAGAQAIKITTDSNGDNLVLSGSLTGGNITLISGEGLTGAGTITASGAVSLKASGGGGINLTGAIAGTSLTVQANSGPVTVSNADNVFNSFTAAAAIGGGVNVTHKGALTVNALDTGANAVTFATNTAGNITLSGDLDSTGGVTLNAAGTLAIQAKINAGGGDVVLNGASITQTAAGIITAAGLFVSSTGAADLSQATSAITTLAGSVASLAFLESDGFSVGTVNGFDGLTAAGGLQLQAGGTITQTKGITAASAAIRTTAGDVNLTGATNALVTFAAKASAGFVAVLEGNDVQVGSVGAIGTLAALDGITATGGVSLRTGAGSVTQTAAGVINAGAAGLAVSVTGGNITLDTATNATALIAFSGAGTATYKTSSDLNVGQVAALGSNPQVTGGTATTSLALTTTGANTVIAQSKLISTGTLTLATGAGGQITLNNTGNLIGSVQSSGTWGTGGTHTIVDSADGLSIGPITSNSDLSITTTGALSIADAVNVGAKTLALTANGSNAITATAAAITAGKLTLETGAGGSASIQTAAHDIGTVQTAGGGVGTGGMVFKQERAGGTIVGPITSAGTVSINDGIGAVTVSGAINVTNANVTLAASADKLNVNAQISAGSGQVALLAQGDITQAVTNAGITADSLRGESSAGAVSLSPTGVGAADVNTVNTFAAISTAGSVSFRNSGTFNVGKVNNTSGINAATSVSLQVNTAGKTITQTAGANGAIIAATLNLTTNNGGVTIDSASNNIAALGTVSLGSGSLTVSTARAAGFDVGAVTANGGIDITNTTGDLTTSAAISSDGNISLRSTTGTLTLGGTVTSNNNGITLRSSGALNTGAFLVSAPTAGTGDVTLISDTSTVTIGAGGVTVGDTLTLQIGAGLTLNVNGAITATSVALHADIIEISAAINATGTITLAPVTAGTAVTVGGAAGAGFVIDSTELGFLTSATTLTVGKQTGGTITAGSIDLAAGDVGNATLNLFSSGGVTQSGSLSIGADVGTLNIAAGGTVNLGPFAGVIKAGVVSGSTTSGDFLFTQGATGTLQVGDITTAGGQIIVRNFKGDLTVSGNLVSNGGFIAVGSNLGASAGLTVNGSINAGTGTVFLFSRDGTTQGGASVITAAKLQAQNFSTNDISLTGQNVVSANVRLDNAGGAVSFTNTVGYALGGIADFNSAVGVFGASDFGIRTAVGSSATLTTGGSITQGGTSTDVLSVGTLNISKLVAANPTVTFDNASNGIVSLGTVSIGSGTLTLVESNGFSISGSVTADSVSLKSGGSISQSLGTTITATSVSATSTGGSVGLVGSATNAFGTITGSAAGTFSATSTQTLTVGAAGVSAGFGLTLTATGAASDLAVDGLVNGNTSFVSLNAGRDITQAATGGVTASQLQLNATAGSVDLTAGAANNNVGTIAGQSSGNFLYTDANTTSLTIGTVSTVGIVSTAGSVTVKATKTGATMTTKSLVTASAANKGITLESTGDLTVNSTLTANNASGRVSLSSSAGSIIETSSGVISAAELLAVAATNVDIAQSTNAVGATGFAATATTGFVVFINTGAIQLDTVGGVNGVTAGGAVVLATTSGDITQTANGIITAGAGLGLAAPGGSIVLDKANLITGNVAVVNTGSGSVTIRNTGALNVGTVGPIATAGVSVPTLNGINASTAAGKFVSLISDTGTVTQSSGSVNAIIGNELRVTTSGKDATLTNTSNSIVAVGNSNLGAGRLTVFDGVGDLTLSDPVVADGGVILTTQTAFNLPGAITVANGDISLTSVTGSIALGSTLSAINGQIQLDAGGAAGTITQTGGTITSKTLIVRAPGDVSLVEANNDVGTIAGRSTTGIFTYVDKTAVTIGSLVDSTAVTIEGITTTNKDIIVVAGKGGAAGGITIDQAVNAGTAIVRFETSKSDITQAVTGLITATSVLANAVAGSVNLAGVANAVTFWSGKSGGSFRIQTATNLGVTDIAADAGALTTAGTGLIANGDVALQTTGAMGFFTAVNAGPGTIRLRTTAAGGTIGQLATGSLIGDALLIDATGAVSLTTSTTNDVNTIAGRTTSGAFRYQDKTGVTIGTVVADGGGLGPVLPIGPLTGITTSGGDITVAAGGLLTINETINAGFGGGTVRLQTGAGDLTQGINGAITGGSLLAVSTGGMVNLTGATNTVSGIAGSAFTSFLFQNSVGYTVSDVAFASDGVVAAATGITANSGGGGTAFVVDLAVVNGTLAINGPVSSANGMIVYRRAPGGTAGAINVGGGAGNAGNDISTAKLVVIDHTGASPLALYGAAPGAGAGGLFAVPTPGTGFSPLPTPGILSGGTSTIGELNGLNTTVYIFGSAANLQSTGGGGATFGLLGLYGQSNTANLTTTVRTVDPNLVRAVTAPFVEPATSGPLAAFYVRHDGLATATEQFNTCPIGTINCVVFTTPIAAPSVSTDDVVIGVAGQPLDDSGIVLVNQGNEELIIDDSEEERKKRKGGGTAQ